MKYAAVKTNSGRRVAIVEKGQPRELLPSSIQDIVELAYGSNVSQIEDQQSCTGEAEIMAPFVPRRNIFCVGKNYYAHAREFSQSGFDSGAAEVIPQYPIIFTKVPECVVATNETVIFDPSVSQAIDYEGELGVIIGHGGKGISSADALDHVWGYTIINDVTARDVQARMKQWDVSKSFDTFCPMGPWAVTRDELDLSTAILKTYVNDEVRQEAFLRDMIFSVPKVIEVLSAGITLLPGDIIATGTPAGVGIGFNPPKYLRDGDVVRIEISGLGSLVNRFEISNSA